MRAPWAKTDGTGGGSHHLAHHCADVAACFEAISSLPVFRRRMEKAAGGLLDQAKISRLSVLAFLHDAGKLHPGFQAKGWSEGDWHGPRRGHIQKGAAIFLEPDLESIAVPLGKAENLSLKKAISQSLKLPEIATTISQERYLRSLKSRREAPVIFISVRVLPRIGRAKEEPL